MAEKHRACRIGRVPRFDERLQVLKQERLKGRAPAAQSFPVHGEGVVGKVVVSGRRLAGSEAKADDDCRRHHGAPAEKDAVRSGKLIAAVQHIDCRQFLAGQEDLGVGKLNADLVVAPQPVGVDDESRRVLLTDGGF